MYREIHNAVGAALLIAPDTQTDDVNGAWLDLQGFNGAEIVFAMGDAANALTGSPVVRWQIKLQHSDDKVDIDNVVSAADVLTGANPLVSDPDANGILATLDADSFEDTLLRVGYRGGRRYVRPVIVAEGTVGATDWCVLGFKVNPGDRPVNDLAAEVNL